MSYLSSLTSTKIRPQRGWYATGASLVANPQGFTVVSTGTLGGVTVTASEPEFTSFTSGAVSGNQAGYVAQGGVGGSLFLSYGRNNFYQSYVKLANADLTNIRFVAGFQDQNSFGALNADTFNTAHVALFRFSSVAADTTWKCLTSNGTSTTVTDSGVTADTNGHLFGIQEDNVANQFRFYIDNNLVCTVTATLPTGLMQWTEIVTTQTTAAKVMDVAWSLTSSDK